MLIKADMVSGFRGFLKESQASFARILDVSRGTIKGIEKGETGITEPVRNKLLNLAEARGYEFIENGVRKKKDGISILRGADGFYQFILDVQATAKLSNGDFCVTNVDEKKFERWQGEHADSYLAEMKRLGDQGNFKFRCLVKKGDTYFTGGYIEYGAVSDDVSGAVSTYIYGNKTAIIIFKEDDVTVHIIHSNEVAEEYRREFNKNWNKAKPVNE